MIRDLNYLSRKEVERYAKDGFIVKEGLLSQDQ
jgi:hypothetical protein